MSDRKREYSSYDETRDRIALRQALTLQARKRGRLAPAEHAIVERGRAAEQRLLARGKLNTRTATRI